MRYSLASLVLATVIVGEAAAASIGHVHTSLHQHAHTQAQILRRNADVKGAEPVEKRDLASLVATGLSKLTAMGIKATGINAAQNNGKVWIGADGPYTNEYTNASPDDLTLVVWGVAASWVAAHQPLITVSIPAGQNATLSFASGASGAWAAIYPDTVMSPYGQISETWGEFTFGPYGVVDVSREVNMAGRHMSIAGPNCVTDMETCVFVCPSGNSCEFGYQLKNCDNGSQQGANYGTYAGAPSGGCGGMGATAKLVTTLGSGGASADQGQVKKLTNPIS